MTITIDKQGPIQLIIAGFFKLADRYLIFCAYEDIKLTLIISLFIISTVWIPYVQKKKKKKKTIIKTVKQN